MRFQHAGQGFGRAANFVHGKVAALMRYLGGEHGQVPRAAPVPHGGKHSTIIPAGQAAHAKAFQHQSAVTALQQGDDIRPHARHQPQHKHVGIQRSTEHRMGIIRRALQELDQAAVPEHGGFGVVDAGKRVKAFGTGLAGAGAKDHLVVKHDLHAPGIRVAGIGHGAPQVVAGIRIAVINRFLAAGQHHRLGAFAYHVAERCGGIAHRVRAMGDDKTIIAVIVFLHSGGNALPLFGAHVGGIQVIQLDGINAAEFRQFRHAGKQLLRGDSRGKPARRRWARSNGAAGCNQQDRSHKLEFSFYFSLHGALAQGRGTLVHNIHKCAYYTICVRARQTFFTRG